MKAQKYPHSIIKPGAVLYEAYGYEYEGTIRVDISEWIVRSIRKKRGSQTSMGFKVFVSDDQVYVNLTEKIDLVTWGRLSKKKGDYGWLKSIPAEHRRQFRSGDNLPRGLYTTPLAALRFELADKEEDTPKFEKYVKDCAPDDEFLEELKQELDEHLRIIKALKTRITKLRASAPRKNEA